MLFPYQYIDHPMNKMQGYIDYIFEVWCKAPSIEYDISLFDGNKELKEIIEGLYHTEPKGADFFIKGIQKIYVIFKNLNATEIEQLKRSYQSNNKVEELCKNINGIEPSTYESIAQINQELSEELKSFFVGLYADSFLSLKILSGKIGVIDDHYNLFVKENLQGKCPFCGLHSIDSEHVHTREAYDHYLPKSKYPFSSINFKNLAPICYKCNSGNKGAKDPIHDKQGNRRKTFYAYNQAPYTLEISVQINSTNLTDLKPANIVMGFGPGVFNEEIQTWNELFGIEERYKATCCGPDAKYWITQILDESQDREEIPKEILRTKLRAAAKNPYRELNFLRKPFLEACNQLHVFD